VIVIIGPPSHVAVAEAAALQRAATALAQEPPAGVTELRVVQAESEVFTFDLVDLAVDSGVDIVCIVGTGAAPLLLEAALTRREARFCGTDAQIAGGPVNISAVALDPMALIEAGAAAIGRAPAPVGLLLADELGDVEALTTAFTEAVREPTQPAPEPVPAPTQTPTPTAAPAAVPTAPPVDMFATVTTGGGQQSLTKAAEDLAALGPSRSLVLATPGTDIAAPTVVAGGSSIVVVADWAVDAEGVLPVGLLAALTVDWSVLLGMAVEAALDDESGQVQLLGLADGVLGALPGQLDGATAAVERTLARIEVAVATAATAAAKDAADQDDEEVGG
jgi:hypothetical protein